MSTADRLTSLTHQLIGDIGRLPGVNLDPAGEAQLGQLLVDAFEGVGRLALEDHDQQTGDYQPCRCGEYETCPACVEAHRQFRKVTAHPGDIIT